jgi:hypothetical protein
MLADRISLGHRLPGIGVGLLEMTATIFKGTRESVCGLLVN